MSNILYELQRLLVPLRLSLLSECCQQWNNQRWHKLDTFALFPRPGGVHDHQQDNYHHLRHLTRYCASRRNISRILISYQRYENLLDTSMRWEIKMFELVYEILTMNICKMIIYRTINLLLISMWKYFCNVKIVITTTSGCRLFWLRYQQNITKW